jgi:3-oxoacyl-[acyl-carrier-protein] synthase III
MKVVYKCTYEAVNEAIDKAKADEREIDCIQLTSSEWYVFHRKLGTALFGRPNATSALYTDEVEYRGVTVTKRKPL